MDILIYLLVALPVILVMGMMIIGFVLMTIEDRKLEKKDKYLRSLFTHLKK